MVSKSFVAGRPGTEPRVTYEDYMEGCPAVQLLNSLSSRWVGPTLSALGRQPGPQRYSAIRRAVPGVTQKMLTQTLRTLERDGLVIRTVTPSVPVRVDYELTDVGTSLYRLLAAIDDWAVGNIRQIERARARYDTVIEAWRTS